MHLPKLLYYTCTAIAAGGMSAEAQNTPEENNLVLDDWKQNAIAGDTLNADRVPETTEILAQRSLKRFQVKLIIYNPRQEEIEQWIK